MEDATYLAMTKITQTWGLAYFLIIFTTATAYALWPSRQKQFDEAARMPLRED
jgi:cytochrome c oxidase cbb3-type subunit IV